MYKSRLMAQGSRQCRRTPSLLFFKVASQTNGGVVDVGS